MANKHASLDALFTDIADAIREKTGDTASIIADDFPSMIRGRLQAIPFDPKNDMYQVNILKMLVNDHEGNVLYEASIDDVALYTDSIDPLKTPVSISAEIKSSFDDMIIALENLGSFGEINPELEGYEVFLSLAPYFSDIIFEYFNIEGVYVTIDTEVNAYNCGEFGPILGLTAEKTVESSGYAEVLEDGTLRLVLHVPGPFSVLSKPI